MVYLKLVVLAESQRVKIQVWSRLSRPWMKKEACESLSPITRMSKALVLGRLVNEDGGSEFNINRLISSETLTSWLMRV